MNRSGKDIVIIAMGLAVVGLGLALFLKPNNPQSMQAKNEAANMHRPAEDEKGRGKPGKTPYEMNQVRNTISKNNSKIRDCYMKFVETDAKVTDGKVLVDWQIASSGDVASSEIVSSEIGSDVLHKCMTDSIKSWKFPPTGVSDPVYTSFTFVFKKEEKAEK